MKAVLVAIAIPIFTQQLEKSRESTDIANVRSAAAEVVATYLADGSADSVSVTAKQTIASWQMGSSKAYIMQQIDGVETPQSFDAKTASDKYVISIPKSGSKAGQVQIS